MRAEIGAALLRSSLPAEDTPAMLTAGNQRNATSSMHLRGRTGVLASAAGLCGLVAFVTFNAGDLAQPSAFDPARYDISYLGALTDSWRS